MYYIRICFRVEWKHPEIRLSNLPKMAAHSSPHEDVLSVATPEGYQEVGKVYLRRIKSYKLTGPKHNLHQGSFSRSMSHEHSHHSIVSLVFFPRFETLEHPTQWWCPPDRLRKQLESCLIRVSPTSGCWDLTKFIAPPTVTWKTETNLISWFPVLFFSVISHFCSPPKRGSLFPGWVTPTKKPSMCSLRSQNRRQASSPVVRTW